MTQPTDRHPRWERSLRLDDSEEWSDGEPSDDETEQERQERTVPWDEGGGFFGAWGVLCRCVFFLVFKLFRS